MKFALTSRQPKDVLINADEIIIQYRDIDTLTELYEQFNDKHFIIDLGKNEEIDYKFISDCASKIKLSCKCYNFNQISICHDLLINFFSAYPVESFYELDQMIGLGVQSIYMGPELFFAYNKVREKNIIVRLVPNVVNNGMIHTDDGLCGPWVRPEDIDMYRQDCVCEFYLKTEDGSNLILERTLYQIYAKDKKWLGSLNKLIQSLDTETICASIDDDFGYYRQNCRNVCKKGESCHYCKKAIGFYNTLKLYKDQKEKKLN